MGSTPGAPWAAASPRSAEHMGALRSSRHERQGVGKPRAPGLVPSEPGRAG